MKKLSLLIALCVLASPSFARNTEYKLPLEEVIELGKAQGKLDGSVQFFLDGQKTPAVKARMSEDMSNKKTNGVGKDDVTACKWAALSALIAFQEKAKTLGANAVVDMYSFYRKNIFKDARNYECHAGAVVVGVTLKGSYATID